MADCGQSEHMTNIFSVTRCSLNYSVDQDLFVCVNVNFCFHYGCSLTLISLPVVHGFAHSVDFAGRIAVFEP